MRCHSNVASCRATIWQGLTLSLGVNSLYWKDPEAACVCWKGDVSLPSTFCPSKTLMLLTSVLMTFNNHLNLAVLSQVAKRKSLRALRIMGEEDGVCVVCRSGPFLSFVLLTKRPFPCLYLWSLHILLILVCHAVRLTGNSKLPVGVNVGVCRWAVMCDVNRVPWLSPKESWDLL